MVKKKFAIIVGHTALEPGAFSPSLNEHEYVFNTALAQKLSIILQPAFTPVIYFRDGHTIESTYQMVGQWKPAASLELHFNSESSGLAIGSGTICNPKWEDYAIELQNAALKALGRVGREDRGISIIQLGDHETRGWANVASLDWPNSLVEPFFGSNVSDCKLFTDHELEWCQGVLTALQAYFQTH